MYEPIFWLQETSSRYGRIIFSMDFIGTVYKKKYCYFQFYLAVLLHLLTMISYNSLLIEKYPLGKGSLRMNHNKKMSLKKNWHVNHVKSMSFIDIFLSLNEKNSEKYPFIIVHSEHFFCWERERCRLQKIICLSFSFY